jgi:hypothetical protein
MLRNINELQGYTIRGTDEDVGKIYEFYVDDDTWTIRYLVVDTGSWLSGAVLSLTRLR